MDFRKLSSVECFLLDMDGTFYLGDKLLPGALEFIQLLKRQGRDFLFLTNNSSKSRVEYVAKLAGFGLELPEEKIFTSGEATARFLAADSPGARIFLVGTPPLEREFKSHGFKLVQKNPNYAVLGFDTTLTYEKLWKLCDFVRDGIRYVATHPDINCPTETGFMPDIGAMIELIAASAGRRPDVIIGKPYPPMIEALERKTGLPRKAIAMVGDRLYTDIALGKTGLNTVLVLSGETSRKDLVDSEFRPDWIVRDLSELVKILSDSNPGPVSSPNGV